MFKYIIIFLLILTSAANAKYISHLDNPLYSNTNSSYYLMQKNLKAVTGENGQMSLEDYEKSINSLPKSQSKPYQNIHEDFEYMDYNKDGLVSEEEYKRFYLNSEANRKKTKAEERRERRQQRKGTYVDPKEEYNTVTKALDEKIEKEKEEALKAQEEALKDLEEPQKTLENEDMR